MFSFWLSMLHTGPPRRGAALTELSPGCHRWFCTKSAASVYDFPGGGTGLAGEHSCSGDAPAVSLPTGYGLQIPLPAPRLWAFSGWSLKPTE